MTFSIRKSLTAATAVALAAGSFAVATPALADRDDRRGWNDRGGWASIDRAQVTEQMNAIAERYGLQPVAYVEADDDEFEAYTRDADGNAAKIELDRFGNVEEVEIEYGFGPRRGGFMGTFASEADVRRSVQESGFEFVALADRKGRHYEIMARGVNDELAELHVSFDGEVYKAKYEPREFGTGGWAVGEQRGEGGNARPPAALGDR
jgi:hypothetical protein